MLLLYCILLCSCLNIKKYIKILYFTNKQKQTKNNNIKLKIHYSFIIRLTSAGEADPGLCSANIVCCPAGIGACVLEYETHNVQGHISKVMDGSEPVSYGNRFAILKPLHSKVGVSDGFKLGLKMCILTLVKILKVARLGYEVWSFAGLNILLPGCKLMGLSLGRPLKPIHLVLLF